MVLEGTTVSSLLTEAGSVGTSIIGFATNIFNWAVTNPVYLTFLGVSLFGVGFGVVRKITHR